MSLENIKKIISILLVVALGVSLIGCNMENSVINFPETEVTG